MEEGIEKNWQFPRLLLSGRMFFLQLMQLVKKRKEIVQKLSKKSMKKYKKAFKQLNRQQTFPKNLVQPNTMIFGLLRFLGNFFNCETTS